MQSIFARSLKTSYFYPALLVCIA